MLLFLIVILLLVPFTLAEKQYSLTLTNTDKGLLYISTELSEGNLIEKQSKSDYQLELFSSSGELLYTDYFNPPSGYYQQFNLNVPYFKNGNEIVILNKNKQLPFKISVVQFADKCGDEYCDVGENYLSCPQDCNSGSNDKICDRISDGICDPDCEDNQDEDCYDNTIQDIQMDKEPIIVKKSNDIIDDDFINQDIKPLSSNKNNLPWWTFLLVLLGLFVIIVIVWIIIDHHKHKKEKLSPIVEYIKNNLQKGYTWEVIKKALMNHNYEENEINKAYRLAKKR